MAGPKRTWWKHIVAASLLTAFFVVGGLFAFSGKASAAATYNWTDSTHVKVEGFDYPQYAGNQTSFVFTCSHAGDKIYTCVTEIGLNQGQTGYCGPQMNFSEDSSRG